MYEPSRRMANRQITDAVINAMLDTIGEWNHLDEIAEQISLPISKVQCAVSHLVKEYGALEQLPLTKAIRINVKGIERYLDNDRNFHPNRLGESERV